MDVGKVYDTSKSVVAARIAGVFMEAHTDPDKALCDGPSAVGLGSVKKYLHSSKRLILR